MAMTSTVSTVELPLTSAAVSRQPLRSAMPRKCRWVAITSTVLMPVEPGVSALLLGVTV